MCTNPLIVRNKSPYKVYDVSPMKYQVPCGKCLECRSLVQSDWCTRLSYEINMFYRNGGIGVFLTFTYNDDDLPVFAPLNQPCFRHDDVLKFLDRINLYMQRTYGSYMYKYFFCSEYGKTTQRPHYHGLFLLNHGVDWFSFVEKARSLWSEHGYMFPKFDGHMYVDNDGFGVSPTLKNGAASAKYVSKYITKDMSFYNIPSISAYLDKKNDSFGIPYKKRKDLIKRCLPKHWQSKGIGISQLEQFDQFDSDSVINALNNGVFEPLSGDVVPLSTYIVNKLMYKSVKSTRLSPTSGKPLYDRYLTDFGRQYFRATFDNRLRKEINKYKEFVQMHKEDTKNFSNLNFVRIALYKLVYRYMDLSCLVDSVLLDGNLSIVDDVDFAFDIWFKNKDTKYLKSHKPIFFGSALETDIDIYHMCQRSFVEPHFFLSMYEAVCFKERALIHDKIQKDKNTIERTKRMFKSHFDKRLC